MVALAMDPDLEAAVAAADAALDRLFEVGVATGDAEEAKAVIRGIERLARRTDALAVAVVAEVDRAGHHRADGHASAKVMVRHVAHLSNAEASRRARAGRALRDLQAVRTAFEEGSIGRCQVDRVTRVHANPRVRQQLAAVDRQVAVIAARASYRDLDVNLANWENLTDEDGARDRNQRAHEARDHRWLQDYDGTWTGTSRCGDGRGRYADIFEHFLAAERAADWEKARAELGDAATADDLPRTEPQRRFDAFTAMAERAAAAVAATPGGSPIVTNVVMDAATHERELARLAGAEVPPRRPGLDLGSCGLDADAGADAPVVGYRCGTLSGHRLEPTEAVVAGLLGRFRRVVVGADGVVIDLGRTRRCFTGAAQLAVQLASSTCYWPGCEVPVRDCQSDHLVGWASPEQGTTCPGNGASACGRHNRLKEHGFRVTRSALGALHVLRPDGSEIT